MNNLNTHIIGLLAHVDAGKTTLTEALLYQSGSIRTLGRVDHKNTFLDTYDLEKKRGITIFSKQANFSYHNQAYTLIDTPGHVDFCAEMERAIEIMDYAILVISGVEGIQSHTETVWNLLMEYNIPTLLFLNKCDREGSNLPTLVENLKQKFHPNCMLWKENDSILEQIASMKEEWIEAFLSDAYSKEQWDTILRDCVNARKIFPCFSGSALTGTGIEQLLDTLDFLTSKTCLQNNAEILTNSNLTSDTSMQDDPASHLQTNHYSNVQGNDFTGHVFKILHDENRNRLTFLKVTKGILKVKDQIAIPDHSEEGVCYEKVNQIRLYHGDKYQTLSEAVPGMLVAVLGITKALPGCSIGSTLSFASYHLKPVLTTRLLYPKEKDPRLVLKDMRLLEEEDPMLMVEWEEELRDISLQIMGPIQLEILKELISERFSYSVDFGPCNILYKETIASPVKGYGHFEPLRHYAEVHLLLEPAKKGSGITFHSRCHVDQLSLNYQRLIGSHVLEKEHRGILTGSPVTDLSITLLAGRAHLKHTEGGDFREATFRAIRQALEKADNVLLEPIYEFEITVPATYLGRVMSDITKYYGNCDAPQTIQNELAESYVTLHGHAPVASFMNYPMELASFSKGLGRISLKSAGYEPCHNQDEVITKIGYDKEKDLKNPSCSVFCSHGSGFVVPWEEAENYMHLEIL